MPTKTQRVNIQNKTQQRQTETNSINNRFHAWFGKLTRSEINKVTCRGNLWFLLHRTLHKYNYSEERSKEVAKTDCINIIIS